MCYWPHPRILSRDPNSVKFAVKLQNIYHFVSSSKFWVLANFIFVKKLSDEILPMKDHFTMYSNNSKTGHLIPGQKNGHSGAWVQLFSNSGINNLTNILTKIRVPIVRHPCPSIKSFTTQDICGIILC